MNQGQNSHTQKRRMGHPQQEDAGRVKIPPLADGPSLRGLHLRPIPLLLRDERWGWFSLASLPYQPRLFIPGRGSVPVSGNLVNLELRLSAGTDDLAAEPCHTLQH